MAPGYPLQRDQPGAVPLGLCHHYRDHAQQLQCVRPPARYERAGRALPGEREIRPALRRGEGHSPGQLSGLPGLLRDDAFPAHARRSGPLDRPHDPAGQAAPNPDLAVGLPAGRGTAARAAACAVRPALVRGPASAVVAVHARRSRRDGPAGSGPAPVLGPLSRGRGALPSRCRPERRPPEQRWPGPVMPTAALVVNRKRIRHVPHLHRRSVAAAAACGWEMELLETRSADAGHGVTREAVTAGAQLVFAVGGDGTVRACAQALAGSQVPLAIVPRGTANLVATALGIPSSLGAALAVGFGQYERRIDLAVADGITFAAMAGIGLDAAVVSEEH